MLVRDNFVMNVTLNKEILLSHAPSGSRVKVVKLDGGESFKAKMISLGIIRDKVLEVTNCDGCSGPMAIKVNQSKLVIGRGMAEKIVVIPE